MNAAEIAALLLACVGVLGCEARTIGICDPSDGCGPDPSAVESAMDPCTGALMGYAERPLIDDFEDGDQYIAELDGRGALQRIYADGAGSVELASIAGGAPNSTQAIRFSGNVTAPLVNGAGWSVPLGGARSVCPLDASSYVGVSFWARGTSGPLELFMVLLVGGDTSCDQIEPKEQCFDAYVAGVSLSEEWQHYELPWSFFDEAALASQPSTDTPSSLAYLYELQFKPNRVGPFAVEIDDVAFLVGTGVGGCNAERPSRSACCGNRACETPEARGIAIVPGERDFGGLLYCPEDCVPDADGCPVSDLGSALSRVAFGHTGLSADDFRGSCSGETFESIDRYSPDAEYLFTAPEDGQYLFNAASELFTPAVYVLDGTCGGNELGCANAFEPTLVPSALSIGLVAQQRVTVVVDGNLGSSGAFTLSVDRLTGSCPDEDLGSTLPLRVSGTTADGENAIVPFCGDLRSPDRTVLWTAPAAGVYRFEATGESVLPVLEIRDGGCDGPELACTHRSSGALLTARASVALSEGQTVAVTVDGVGAAVEYDLSISPLVCPAEDLGSALPLTRTGNTIGLADLVTAPCGLETGAPDVAFAWTAPADGNYVFDTVGSGFDTVVYVLDGITCEGTLRSCDDDTRAPAGRIQLPFVEGQSAIVVVDGSQGDSVGEFVLNITAAP